MGFVFVIITMCSMPDAVPTNKKCLFTGKDTNSREHVIPMWLQRQFGLQEQSLVIPNGTRIRYKHHTVPAESEANNTFGQIESRIAQGVFDLAGVYLWAMKLHIGCIFRDSSLRFDIKDQSSPFVLGVTDYDSEIAMFRLLYEHWRAGNRTNPSPLGSVFVIDSLMPVNEFDFFHCLVTGTVGIHIGGKFIVVFFWDQGAAADSNMLEIWEKYHVPNVPGKVSDPEFDTHAYMAHHVWACECAYGLYRRRRTINLLRTPTQLAIVPSMAPPSSRPMDADEYSYVCGAFGLDLLKFNGETNNVYKAHDRMRQRGSLGE